jgi:hypothetical protein
VTIRNRKAARNALKTARTVELEYAAGWSGEVVDMFRD